MSPVADLSAVATAGRDAGSAYLTLLNHPDTALGAVPFLLTALGTNVGQGGKNCFCQIADAIAQKQTNPICW